MPRPPRDPETEWLEEMARHWQTHTGGGFVRPHESIVGQLRAKSSTCHLCADIVKRWEDR